jgi:hypothetical protein
MVKSCVSFFVSSSPALSFLAAAAMGAQTGLLPALLQVEPPLRAPACLQAPLQEAAPKAPGTRAPRLRRTIRVAARTMRPRWSWTLRLSTARAVVQAAVLSPARRRRWVRCAPMVFASAFAVRQAARRTAARRARCSSAAWPVTSVRAFVCASSRVARGAEPCLPMTQCSRQQNGDRRCGDSRWQRRRRVHRQRSHVSRERADEPGTL